MSIGIWQISDDRPSKLNGCCIDIIKSLEDWIEDDPSLLQSGLTIVGRQVPVDAGRVDLLALDPQGRYRAVRSLMVEQVPPWRNLKEADLVRGTEYRP